MRPQRIFEQDLYYLAYLLTAPLTCVAGRGIGDPHPHTRPHYSLIDAIFAAVKEDIKGY